MLAQAAPVAPHSERNGPRRTRTVLMVIEMRNCQHGTHIHRIADVLRNSFIA